MASGQMILNLSILGSHVVELHTANTRRVSRHRSTQELYVTLGTIFVKLATSASTLAFAVQLHVLIGSNLQN